jgi:hypothetical protein
VQVLPSNEEKKFLGGKKKAALDQQFMKVACFGEGSPC